LKILEQPREAHQPISSAREIPCTCSSTEHCNPGIQIQTHRSLFELK
jgi:hypothetical protein